MGICIRNLDCGVGDTPILHDISLTLNTGMIGIIGPNGAGKTTLLRTISGYLKPERGSVEIDGTNVREIGVKALAKKMALVPQNYALEYDFTVLETVLMGRNPHKKTFEGDSMEDIRLARAAIAKTGIAHLENRSVIGLSGGEWQRMIIARALTQQSSILLLDEPVSSLDIKHQVGILSLVRMRPARSESCKPLLQRDRANEAGAHCPARADQRRFAERYPRGGLRYENPYAA